MKQYLYSLFLSALLLCACQKQETEPIAPSQRQQELRFCTYLQENGEIRPVSRSFVEEPLSAGYYLSGLLSTSDYPSGVAYERLMWNVGTNKDGTYKSSTTKYFWMEGDAARRHSFIAYSATPVGSSGGHSATPTGATSIQPLLSLAYTNADDPAKQVDFLYADNASNLRVSKHAPVVNLIFKHRLARVMVKLIGTSGVPLTACQAEITYKASTVKNSGTVQLGDNAAIVFGATHHAGTYNLGSPFSLPGTAISTATAVEVGDIILLPKQSLGEGWATLKLNYTPDGVITALSSTMDLPAVDLTAATGKQYNILINVIVESQNLSVAGVTLLGWTSKIATIDKL